MSFENLKCILSALTNSNKTITSTSFIILYKICDKQLLQSCAENIDKYYNIVISI